jgi:hypothetical protein
MSLQTYAGTFTLTAGITTQTVSGIVDKDGAAFTPKVVLAWCDRNTAEATFTADYAMSFGAAVDRATDQQGMMVSFADDNVGANDALRGKYTDDFIKSIANTGPGYNVTARISSFGSGQFVINKTVNDGTNLPIVKYLALGGTDIDDAYLMEIQAPAAASGVTYTGVPFQGNLVVFFGNHFLGSGNQATGTPLHFIGAATSSSAEAVAACYTRNASAANLAKSYSSAAACVAGFGTATDGIRILGDFTAWTSDGFTINWSVADGAVRHVFALILKGSFQTSIGQQARPTTNTTQDITTGFEPLAGLIVGTFATTTATAIVKNHLSLGAFDQTRNHGKWWGDEATINTETNMYSSATKCYTDATGPSTVVAQAGVSAVAATQFTLDWTTTDANARLFMHLALGSSEVVEFGTDSGRVEASESVQPITVGVGAVEAG